MSEPKEPIYHLLKPKEHRTWCRQSQPPSAAMNVTTQPSKANCATCLTRYRRATGKGKTFRVRWTNRYDPQPMTPEIEP